MKGKKPLDWIPIYIDKHLFGSTRLELEPDERSVWMDLLVLSGKDDGFIRANEGVPYPHAQLAGLLVISEELLARAVKKCVKYKKIKIRKDLTMFVPSWEEYKLSNRHKRRLYLNKDIKRESNNNRESYIYRGSKKTDIVSDNPDIDPIDLRLTQLLVDLMLENDPRSYIIKELTGKRQLEWMKQCRLLREADKRTEEEIETIIRWSQKDQFWKANILSMPTLREKFSQLWLKANKTNFSGIQDWIRRRREQKSKEGKCQQK